MIKHIDFFLPNTSGFLPQRERARKERNVKEDVHSWVFQNNEDHQPCMLHALWSMPSGLHLIQGIPPGTVCKAVAAMLFWSVLHVASYPTMSVSEAKCLPDFIKLLRIGNFSLVYVLQP